MSQRVVSSNCWTYWYFQTPQMLLWHKNIMKYKTFLYCQTNIALSCQQPARWLRFLQIFNPQREFKSCALLPYFNYPLHKWSSCIKSDLGRVHNTGYLHNSTPFSKPASSGSIFHASKLPVNPQNWVPLPAPPPATGVCFPRGIMQHNLFPPWPLHPAPAQKLT